MSQHAPFLSAAPDWDHITEDVHCPLCEYNLRGLPEPRCPECGYRFEWADVFDPARRVHPYLFEHHPLHKWRSFWRTAWGSLRPERFWSSLKPTQPSYPKRLIGYWLICVGMLAVAVLGFHAIAAARFALDVASWTFPYASTLPSGYATGGAIIDLLMDPEYHMELLRRGPEEQLVVPVLMLLGAQVVWPWVTMAVLMVFQQSMHRAKVKKVHVLRCILYSMDTAVWVSGGLVITSGAAALFGNPWDVLGASVGVGLCWALAAPAFMWRLCQAYKRHLQFDHPVLTVLVAQFVGLLALFTVLAHLAFH